MREWTDEDQSHDWFAMPLRRAALLTRGCGPAKSVGARTSRWSPAICAGCRLVDAQQQIAPPGLG